MGQGEEHQTKQQPGCSESPIQEKVQAQLAAQPLEECQGSSVTDPRSPKELERNAGQGSSYASPLTKEPKSNGQSIAAANPQGPKQGATSPSEDHVINMGPIVESASLQFAETAMRNAFVRKVLGIISLQLLFTAGFVAVCMLVPQVQHYLSTKIWPMIVAMALSFAILIVLICWDKARRTWPYNMVSLALFTLMWAFMLGTLSAFYKLEMVLLAFGITTAVVISIVIFALNTKVDATQWGSMLLVLGWTVLVSTLTGIFWHTKIWRLVVSGIACLVFSAYILMDIQLMMGGEHRKYSISPDEYVFAALIIYMDIIDLFMYLLGAGGSSGGS